MWKGSLRELFVSTIVCLFFFLFLFSFFLLWLSFFLIALVSGHELPGGDCWLRLPVVAVVAVVAVAFFSSSSFLPIGVCCAFSRVKMVEMCDLGLFCWPFSREGGEGEGGE